MSAAHPSNAAEFAKIIDLRVACRIRKRRLSIGMTQQKFAKTIGVAFQQAHKYERCPSRVTAGRLFHIATALGTPITYFFAPESEPATTNHDPKAIGNED